MLIHTVSSYYVFGKLTLSAHLFHEKCFIKMTLSIIKRILKNAEGIIQRLVNDTTLRLVSSQYNLLIVLDLPLLPRFNLSGLETGPGE